MKLQLTDRNLQRYHLAGTLVVVVVLALALAGSFLWIGLTEHRQITQRFEQAQQKRPEMKSVRMRAPNSGGGSMSLAGMSSTSETASTTMPICWLGCPSS